MNSPGMSDSFGGVTVTPKACPVCKATLTVNGGECLTCLLRAGLEADDSGTAESFEAVLAEVDVPDTEWRLGNYQILAEIGRGGMGVIYRARQRHSKRIVALKRVLGYHGDSHETLERFRREAEAAASLDHPNILPIYEVGEADGLPFFTMKLATGGSLQHAATAFRDDPRECVRLVAKVARAVAYAHRQGILHRDLKPGNILLDWRAEPLVSDFGLAKWVDVNTDLTRSLAIFGTPGFIAPEQARGVTADLSAAADIYSLGAILFDLLAGRAPFLGEHALAVIHQAAENAAPKLRSLKPALDRDLETICAKCLEREPAARYRSAADLAEDLERWLEGREIVARPVSPPARLWRWSRRNPLLATAAVIVLLISGVAFLGEAKRAQLRNAVHQERLLQRSAAVLPLLDLDNAQVDLSAAKEVAGFLQTALVRSSPARVVPIALERPWLAGAASLQDIREATRHMPARLVIAGTTRMHNGHQRISFRFIEGASGRVLGTHHIERVPPLRWTEVMRELALEVEAIMEKPDWSELGLISSDPGMRNDAARDFIVSARQLMLRQTLEDYDRAIVCLERALEMEPESATAHAFMATVAAARTHLVPDERFLLKAEQAAREALRLEPNSADARRSLAGVYHQTGHLRDALEEAFRAVEAAGPEERGAGFIGMTLERLGEPVRAHRRPISTSRCRHRHRIRRASPPNVAPCAATPARAPAPRVAPVSSR
jgi:tetratricopeptide (TPR) repeat protein